MTAEFTPIEPDVFERKYYARDIGLFLEVELESGEHRPARRVQRRPGVREPADAVTGRARPPGRSGRARRPLGYREDRPMLELFDSRTRLYAAGAVIAGMALLLGMRSSRSRT